MRMKVFTALILLSIVVCVSIIVSPTCGYNERSVGVKKGDWMEYHVDITGIPPPVHKGVVGMRIEILRVDGTGFPANFTLTFANGTKSSSIWQFNFTEGNVGGWIIIPSNLSPGDCFHDNFSKTEKYITIQSQEQKTVLGASRTVTYANDSYRHKQWDKATGVFLGSSETFKNWSAHVNMVATNLWTPQITGLDQTTFYAIIATAAVAVTSAAIAIPFALRRTKMRKPSISIDAFAALKKKVAQVPRNKQFRPKTLIAAAVITIAVVLSAVFLVPIGNAENISLSVDYSLGEKLTYNLTTSTFYQIGNSSTNSTKQSILTIEVVNINAATYTLKYTMDPGAADSFVSTPRLMELKKADVVNLFTLLPVALLEYTENINVINPLEIAVAKQSEAKVGETLQIPVNCADADVSNAKLNVKFVALKDLLVEAGDFRVFKIEFTQTSAQPSQDQLADESYGSVFGESHLEVGSCKQIQSTLQFNMTTSLGNGNGYSTAVTTYSSNLIKDELKPN